MDNTITTTTVILVFIVIIVIACMSAWLIPPAGFDTTNWKVFIVTLSSLSIVMTFMFYYAVVELQLSQQLLNASHELQYLEKSVQNITDVSMPKYYDIIPEFVMSMQPLDYPDITLTRKKSSRSKEKSSHRRKDVDVIGHSSGRDVVRKWHNPYKTDTVNFEWDASTHPTCRAQSTDDMTYRKHPTSSGVINFESSHESTASTRKSKSVRRHEITESNLPVVSYNKKLLAENALSNQVFSLWQSTLQGTKFTNECERGYTTLYLQWATSIHLHKRWKLQKVNFPSRTQEFGDMLFSYASSITIKTPIAYENLSCQLIESCEYQNL